MISRAFPGRVQPSSPRLTGRDVVVIGAGPAGATAARVLAERGHDVLIVDKETFPRDKVCGDGLIPDALNGLRRAGLYEQVVGEGNRADTLSVYSASGIRVDLHGEFVTLKRQRLDYLLLTAAMRSGAEFRIGRVVDIRHDVDGCAAVTADDGIEVSARIMLVATGAESSLVTRAPPRQLRRASAIALRCYVRSPVCVDRLVMSFGRAIAPGYAWIFPLGNGEYNVGCGVFQRRHTKRRVNLRAMFRAFTEEFPLARDLWQHRTGATRLVGARLRCGLDPTLAYAGGRVLAIGETIGATFPFTGEGIGKAMETGELAAEHVDAALRTGDLAPLAGYARRLDEQLAPMYTGYRIAENWLCRPWVGDWIAERMRRRPALQRMAAGVVNETADPKALFSLRRLLPELLPWRSEP